MKVLFAVNSENVSDTIIKKYLKDYREILSFNNVYYFNAIQKEIQKDKTYDRIVISEDLEPFSSNNYESIDKSIIEKLDMISDEAHDAQGNEIPIILICSDRHTKGTDFFVKLFSLGVYNALIGTDRSKEEVCKLINKPRTKKESKLYYKIDTDNASYKVENENEVKEAEIQSIIAHFKKLGKNTEKYAKSFDEIAKQYSDEQLKIVVNCLPSKVQMVLMQTSPKYKKIMQETGKMIEGVNNNALDNMYNQSMTGLKIDILESNKRKIDQPIVIPGATKPKKKKSDDSKISENIEKKSKKVIEVIPEDNEEFNDNIEEKVSKKKKEKAVVKPERKASSQIEKTENDEVKKKKKKKKNKDNDEEKLKKHSKDDLDDDLDDIDLKELDELDELDGWDENEEEKLSNDDTDTLLKGAIEEDDDLDEDFDEDDLMLDDEDDDNFGKGGKELENIDDKINYSMSNLNSLMTKDKKIVSFVGSPKNGVSFLVNNLAEIFASVGINTAILDMTKNKNSYYIYTKNEEALRKVAYSSIDKLQKGIAEGIKVKNNITVYTTIPNDEKDYKNIEAILSTVIQNHSLVLIDCDFNTPVSYFANSQEIYLVQSMDILTIQPLTEFLRDLKVQNILDSEKIKIVINKELKVRTLTNKAIIGAMTSYNDPAMSYMTDDLFNKDVVRYCSIPFDENVYARYLDGLVETKISINGYSKNFMVKLKTLADMVYPLTSRQTYSSNYGKQQNGFSSNMNDTLNKMKKKM